MGRLRCQSENHRTCRDPDAAVTRCARCGKPTCAACEGTDNGFRDICDRCWCVLDDYVTRLVYRFDTDGARRVLRKWGRRSERVNLYTEYGCMP